MKQESTFMYVLRLGGTLLLITAVVAGLLAGVNSITAPRIQAAREEKTRNALSAVIPDAASAQQVQEFDDQSGVVTAVYRSDSAYAVQVAPKGFDSAINMMVGVDDAGKVLGIRVISHTETSGLGAVAAADNAKGEAFRAQFAGCGGGLAVTKDGGTIDALTGATITSRAVTAGVNAAVACVEALG